MDNNILPLVFGDHSCIILKRLKIDKSGCFPFTFLLYFSSFPMPEGQIRRVRFFSNETP